MKITKYAQCCLLIEIEGKRILTDPGAFSSEQNELENIDIILITHEHADHFHTESVQAIVEKNPDAEIITNSSVGKLLAELDIVCHILEGGSATIVGDLHLESYDGKHAEIFGEYGMVQNTGYFIADKLFYPGDAYTVPGKAVPVLALPVAGPWCKIGDAIRYALDVNPEKAFPVHDYLLNDAGKNSHFNHCSRELTAKNIAFTELREGETQEF